MRRVLQVKADSRNIWALHDGLLQLRPQARPRAAQRSAHPTPPLRASKAPTPTPPAPYLGEQEAADLLKLLRVKLPPEIQTRLEVPRVDAKWYLREQSGCIVTLPGDTQMRFGRTPWFLMSPAKLPASIPESGSAENVPSDQPWRFGYYPVIANDKREMGAFVAQLPPDFDPKNPAASVKRIVLVVGSGDNRARSIMGEFGGFSAPGTLFVAFDMPMLSVGMDTPEWAGRASLSQGLAHMRKTLGLSDGIPQYLAGFSAGGAAAMVQAFQPFPEIRAITALSPVIFEYNVHAEVSKTPGTIPASPDDQFAKTAARGTPFTQTLAFAGQLARHYFTPEQFENVSPQRHLSRGEMPRVPLLITGGTDDEIAQPVVRSSVELASFNKGITLPVVFGPQDDQDGKRINIEGFADELAHRPGMAAVTLEGVDHRPRSDVKRPDGKTWTIDARELMMRFFLELERQS